MTSRRHRHRRRLLWALTGLVLLWWLWGWLVPWPDCRVLHEQIVLLNAVAVDLDVGGHRIYLDLHYRQDGVVIDDPGGDGRHGVPYEPCYMLGSFDAAQERDRHDFLPTLLYPLRRVAVELHWLGLELVEYGIRGGMMARVEGKPWQKPLLDRAVRCYLGGRDTLLSTYIPRLVVEQRINGDWQRLTQFNQLGMTYYLAPQDTVWLRMSWTAMRAVYLRERVVITPVPEDELRDLRLVVRRTRDGYWPVPASHRPCQKFFRTFRSDTLSFGERFAMSYPIKPYFGSFELEAVVIDSGHLRYHQLLRFKTPNMAIRGYRDPRTLTYWPLVPTPMGLEAGERSEKGYPGGFIVPRWALERIKRLGPLFFVVDWNSPTGRLYGDELRAWDDSVGRYLLEQAHRKHRPPIRSDGR